MKKDIVEIFGYASADLTKEARLFWDLKTCPFIKQECIKHNHDQSIIYGTCSVSNRGGDVIICPNRLYSNNYQTLKTVAIDAFGSDVPFYFFRDYIDHHTKAKKCVVCLGQNSGKEVKVGKSLSMDWVLALIEDHKLKEYVGIEAQSIDISNNYRDTWHAYKNLPQNPTAPIPASKHGLNWANVHKRLIPQLIRKGLVYSRSKYVAKGLYFIVPDAVYKKFEEIVGKIPNLATATKDTISVYTYSLDVPVTPGKQRNLVQTRLLRFSLSEFSNRFIEGKSLPSGDDLDKKIIDALGLE